MFKLFKNREQKKDKGTKTGYVNEIHEIFDEIEAKKKRFSENKAIIEEEINNGSRITKHKFTL